MRYQVSGIREENTGSQLSDFSRQPSEEKQVTLFAGYQISEVSHQKKSRLPCSTGVPLSPGK